MTDHKLGKAWKNLAQQTVSDSSGKVWSVAEIVDYAKDLDVFDLPLKHICTAEKTIGDMSIRRFVRHMKQVLDCDFEYPIILDEEGAIFDGRHRVAKALLEGISDIKAVRFDKDPPPTYTENKT